jgi:hypothetical protein
MYDSHSPSPMNHHSQLKPPYRCLC